MHDAMYDACEETGDSTNANREYRSEHEGLV